MTAKPEITPFFDGDSNTITYVVRDPGSTACAVVDCVMDIDYSAGRLSFESADVIIDFIIDRGYRLDWLIETHVHADHLSAAPYIQQKLGGKTMISEKIMVVQETFGKIFNDGTEFARDGSQFDVLLKDGDSYGLGAITCTALHTPGHTPACMTHVIGDVAFVGDTLFMPDSGSARADFPGGDAGELYDSIQKILSLPEDTRLFMCHDYGADGRDVAWESSVAEQKAQNIHVGGGKTREDFVAMREARDAMLAMPRLILPSLQVNMRAGEVPADPDGNPMLKVPVNKL
jgi:glyoxylase-like metal-dependent hydrolase (beta-lactamase superfamily II)